MRKRYRGRKGESGRKCVSGRQTPYFSPGSHSNSGLSHSSLVPISARATVAWEPRRYQGESCLIPTWRQAQEEGEKNKRQEEGEKGNAARIHCLWVTGTGHQCQSTNPASPRLPAHTRTCTCAPWERQEHGGSLWNYHGKWEVNRGRRKQPGQCKFQGLPGGVLVVHEHWWSHALSSALQLVITPV